MVGLESDGSGVRVVFVLDAFDLDRGLELELSVDQLERQIDAHDQREHGCLAGDDAEVHGDLHRPGGAGRNDRDLRVVEKSELDLPLGKQVGREPAV